MASPCESAPFDVARVAREFGTPCWLYRQETIERRIADVSRFDVVRFAQKACSNLSILKVVKDAGAMVDAVSAGEIVRALRVGYDPRAKVPGVVYTADIFDREALDLVERHRVPVNIGSADMLEQLAERGIRVPLTVRINPGFGHGHSRKVNTGGDLSKHGVWHEDLPALVARADELGYPISGLHMHIGSGSDFAHLSQVGDAMVKAALLVGSSVRTISAGGGLPISYRKGDEATPPIDLLAYFELWDCARKMIEKKIGHAVTLEVEPGRYLVAESGYLVAEIRAVKNQGKNRFYLLDAGFTDLVRPSFYGAYHYISIYGKDGAMLVGSEPAVVAGPLCESGDVFTQEEGGFVTTRDLPEAQVGDLLVFHDAGAYGAAMSSNYNSRPLAPEVLEHDGELRLIRRRQSLEDIFRLEEPCASL